MKRIEQNSFPVVFTYDNLKETVLSIKINQFTPKVFFPTIDDIDNYIIDRKDGNPHNTIEDIRFLIWNILYGYDRDNLWHEQNPGCNSGNIYDLMKYIFRPAENKLGSLHTNVWGYDDEETEAEDKEAAFEYIQDILSDINYFRLEVDFTITDELYYEILLRTYFKKDISNIKIEKDKITIIPSKKSVKTQITTHSFSSLFYFWYD